MSERTPVPASVVREWAAKNGLPVGARGHLPAAVVKAFNHRHHRKIFVTSNPWENRAPQNEVAQ